MSWFWGVECAYWCRARLARGGISRAWVIFEYSSSWIISKPHNSAKVIAFNQAIIVVSKVK